MNKYRRVQKARDEEAIPENEIRVRHDARIGRYLRRANDLFNRSENPFTSLEIRGIGPSIESVLKLTELIKHRFYDIHQMTEVTMSEFVDEFEPLEEGLDVVKLTKHQPMLKITLSKDPLDKKAAGY